MDTIKIKIVDFGSDNAKDNFIYQVLQKKFNVVYSDEPDFLFYSVYGNEHLKYQCVKIFYTGEPVTPDFNECDYAIGFDYIQFEDRYLRLPLFAMQIDKPIVSAKIETSEISKRKFCNFIYSNETVGNGAALRKQFCLELMKYKHVDCPGIVLHNMTEESLCSRYASNWYDAKTAFLGRYKFTIAFENTLMNGYTTEKLLQPLMAHSIPVYYGNPRVGEEFNTKAFINCSDYDYDFTRITDRIKEIDRDNDLAADILNQPAFRDNHSFNWQDKLLDFLSSIVQKGNRPFYRRNKENSQNIQNELDTLNKHAYGQGIVAELKKYPEIAIFGDGIYGNRIGDLILTCQLGNLTQYIVSHNEENKKTLKRIKVSTLNDTIPDKDCLVLVAVREEAAQAVTEELRNRGFINLLCINETVLEAVNAVVRDFGK